MSETMKPTRLRGAKLLEQGYRAGYADGMRDALAEMEARAAMDNLREERLRAGLAQLRQVKTSEPKRPRRKRANGVAPHSGDPDASTRPGMQGG